MIFKIAWKNVAAAGVRTWLNTFIVALTLILIIFMQGMYDGMLKEIVTNRKAQELGNGQYWHKNYDPYDPLTLKDAHSELSPELLSKVERREAAPVLMVAGTVYPQGRVIPAVLKGIPPDQQVVKIPFQNLNNGVPDGVFPASIGRAMARQTQLSKNDVITVQWRNSKGSFNAVDLMIVDIFESKVPNMDMGQVWLRWSDLQKMNLSPNHATIVISATPIEDGEKAEWIAKALDTLLADTYEFVAMKSSGGNIFYALMIVLTIIAIFDTQTLSIFKRRKEIGTLMALGLNNRQVTWTFTIEGMIYGLLACGVTATFGNLLFWYIGTNGIDFGMDMDQFGLAMSSVLYPIYTPGLIIKTMIIVLVLITVISYIPARKISKLQPYVALRGKWS